MKISIVIPVYNVENFLVKCLDSVVKQTYQDIEIIIVNDGSTDQSYSILQRYLVKDKRIKVINQENQGLSAARNVGMENVSGEYVWFVDSDDYIAIDACEKIVDKLNSKPFDLLFLGRYRVWDKCKLYDRVSWEGEKIETGEQYLLGAVAHNIFTASACNKIIKTSLLKEYNIYFEQGVLYEDLYFVFKCLLHADCVTTLEQALYFYRQNRQDSIINTIKERDKDVLKTIEFIENYVNQVGKQQFLDEYYLKVLVYSWVSNAVCFKYPSKMPFSRRANRIVRDIINDVRYNKYVYYFAYSKNVEFKWKLPAWLSLNCYPLFVFFIFTYFNLKKIFR